ncbi:MAG TPA: hypothetical protein VGQ99_23225 [Tepidisphaeraceae bacterium]|jgi:hypothetical protein|nr:hypothetical protein [Tepidisphaeraceae bacterium]
MPGEHGAVEAIIQVCWVLFLIAAVAYGIYITVRFWINFAEGINESNPKRHGFEVKAQEKPRM